MVEIHDLGEKIKTKQNAPEIRPDQRFKTQYRYFENLQNKKKDEEYISKIILNVFTALYVLCTIGYFLSYKKIIFDGPRPPVNILTLMIIRDISISILGFLLLRKVINKILRN